MNARSSFKQLLEVIGMLKADDDIIPECIYEAVALSVQEWLVEVTHFCLLYEWSVLAIYPFQFIAHSINRHNHFLSGDHRRNFFAQIFDMAIDRAIRDDTMIVVQLSH